MRKHRPPEQWGTLIDLLICSGLSAIQFCNQHDIDYASFCNWRKRLSASESEETGFLDLSSLIAEDSTHYRVSPGLLKPSSDFE